MRSAISTVRIALAMVVLGLAVVVVARPTVSDAARDVPLPAARSVAPSPHNNHNTPNATPSGTPPPPVISCGGCVTQTAPSPTPTPTPTPTPPPPSNTPPPPTGTPNQPENVPPPPVVLPAVSVAPTTPADIPTPSAVPTPAPVPVAAVQLTSSNDGGTQAGIVILLFVVFGGWFYGNRIASHWNSRESDHDRVST